MTYSITAASINDANVAVDGTYTYDGSAKEPADITVKLNGKTLTKDTDYTVTCSNNVNSGTAKVIVTGKGNYEGTAEGTFTITDETKPTGEIKIGENGWKKFINWISFGLFYKDNVDVTVTADGTGSDVVKVEYLFSFSALDENNMPADGWTEVTESNGKYKFSIQPQNKGAVYVRITDDGGNVAVINSDGIVVYADSEAVTESVSTVYKAGTDKNVYVNLNGNDIKSIANGTTTIRPGYDYSVDTAGIITLKADYLNTLDAGEYTFTVSYNTMGEETDKVTITTTFTVTVEKASITDANVEVSGSYTYNGNAHTPEPTVTLGGRTLMKDVDYTVFYSDNVKAGTATVTVIAKGNYKDSASTTFEIGKADLTEVAVQDVELTYNGEAQTPSVSTSATTVDGLEVTFTYSTVQNGTYGDMPSFENSGTYTVYYKATAPNHNEATGSFTVTVDKAIVNDPTIAGKAYTGTVLTADISDTELYTVEANNGGIAKGSYNVVLKLKDADNYKWSITDDAEVTLQFVIAAAENSWTTEPSIEGWTYGEDAKAYSAAAKFGTVKVVYSGKANDGSDYNSETAPTKAGDYKATFTVDGTEDYSSLSEQVNFTIAKANYNMTGTKWDYTDAFDYDGKVHTVWFDEDSLPDGVTVSNYTGNTNSQVGKYTANVAFAYDYNNYNHPEFNTLLEWEIKNDWSPTEYIVSTSNDNSWLKDAFVITPADGYKVSLTNTADGEWTDKLTYSAETDNGSVTFYLKNEGDGTISLGKTVSYKIDTTPATGKVEFVDRTGCEEFLNNISFGLFYKDEVTVKVTANDTLSGVASVEYYAANKAMTLDEVKAITDWTAYTDNFGVSVEDTKQFVYFVRITDNAGNVTYLSTDGAVYDTTAPVISGVENGKTYYTMQRFTVIENNLESVTVNGYPSIAFALGGNVDKEYTIVVTDKAGNSTTVTVTMKPISDLSATIDTLDKDNVNSSNEQVVNDVKAAVAVVDTTNATDAEKAALKEISDKAAELEKVIDDTKAEIARITEELNKYDDETVKSTDKDAIEQLIEDIDALLETENLTEDEEKSLEDAKSKAKGLLDTIEDVAEATDTENTEKVKDVTAENVTPEDKTDLEKAKEDLEKALEDNGGNYTDEEKKAIEDEIKRIDDALEVIGNVEEVEELMDKLPENITKNDDDAIKAADDAYNALSDYEKSLVDEDAKKALDDAKAALAELNKPADPNSPQTGDNSNMMLWIALLFISGGAVITLTVVDRKRRTASK